MTHWVVEVRVHSKWQVNSTHRTESDARIAEHRLIAKGYMTRVRWQA